jgi:hypothetical protein
LYTWLKREPRFRKKFAAGRAHIPKLFEGFEVPTKVDQVALLAYGSRSGRSKLGGGKLVMIPDFMNQIRREGLNNHHSSRSAVPEQFTILRALQFANDFWDDRKAGRRN